MTKLLSIIAFALIASPGALASVQASWTPTTAAAKLKATYTTIDQKAYAYHEAKLKRDLAQGLPETDPQIIAIRHAMEAAKHQAKATRAVCKGAGRAVAGRYSRFHCTAVVQGVARIPPDYVLYTASKKLTVVVRPFRIAAGWR